MSLELNKVRKMFQNFDFSVLEFQSVLKRVDH